MKLISFVAFIGLVYLSPLCDTFTGMNVLVNEFNVYAPSVIIDDALYKMWYGGWRNASDSLSNGDMIYYRSSVDNVDYSSRGVRTVLTPSMIGPNAMHVNDPSVTMPTVSVIGYKYVMFYTVGVKPGAFTDTEIWSSESQDGINWVNHKMIATGGASEPSAVWDSGLNIWRVYCSDRHNLGEIGMFVVNQWRNAVSAQSVYSNYGLGTGMSNPEVKYFNHSWQLFFNVWLHNPDHVDIYKVTSSSLTDFNSSSPELIVHNEAAPNQIWGTLTPGVLPGPANVGNYSLYFGVVQNPEPLNHMHWIYEFNMND